MATYPFLISDGCLAIQNTSKIPDALQLFHFDNIEGQKQNENHNTTGKRSLSEVDSRRKVHHVWLIYNI